MEQSKFNYHNERLKNLMLQAKFEEKQQGKRKRKRTTVVTFAHSTALCEKTNKEIARMQMQ